MVVQELLIGLAGLILPCPIAKLVRGLLPFADLLAGLALELLDLVAGERAPDLLDLALDPVLHGVTTGTSGRRPRLTGAGTRPPTPSGRRSGCTRARSRRTRRHRTAEG